MADKDKVVAIGPHEEMFGLRTIGIEVVRAEDSAQMLEALRAQVERAGVRVVIVSETVAGGTAEAVRELRREHGTVIMLVPSHGGARGVTQQWMKQVMEQAIGVDVISEERQ